MNDREPRNPSRQERDRRGEEQNDRSGSNEDVKKESFFESLILALKLKALRRKFQIENVKLDVVDELGDKLSSGTAEEKVEAKEKLNDLVEKSLSVENEYKDGEPLSNAVEDPRAKAAAVIVERRIEDYRSRVESGEVVSETQLSELRDMIEEFGSRSGVDVREVYNTVEEVREKGEVVGNESSKLFEREIGQLLSLRDRLKITEYREGIESLTAEERVDYKKELSEALLEMEDFKGVDEIDENQRVFRVRRGRGRENLQRDVDEFIGKVKKDISEGRIEELKESVLMERFLEARKHARRSFMYAQRGDEASGEMEDAYDTSLLIGFLYQEQLVANFVEKEMEKLGKGASKRTRDQYEGMLRGVAVERMGRVWSRRGSTSEKEGLDSLYSNVGEEFRRGRMWGDEDSDEDVRGADRRERRANENNPFGAREKSESFVSMEEKLRNEDYKGYVKELMAYLHKVGLAEGRQDWELGRIMREAREKLTNQPDESLLKLYSGFEILTSLHERFPKLRSAEDYAGMLNAMGVEPYQAWLDTYANSLTYDVEVGEGEAREKKDLAAWRFYDDMQSEKWANKLIYTSHLSVDEVFDQMTLSRLYGEGEYDIDVEHRVIKRRGTHEEHAFDETIKVDGEERRIESFIKDARWMSGIAYDLWRYNGRWANLLDNIHIGEAKINKPLMSVYKIRRYCETYGIVPSYMFEALGMDTYIFSFENYKGLLGKGIGDVLEMNPGVDKDEVVGILSSKLTKKRSIRGEEFNADYVSLDDARIIGRRDFSMQDARVEYARRQKAKGYSILDENGNLSAKDERQASFLYKAWKKLILTDDQRSKLEGVDWVATNAKLARRLGYPEGQSIGDSFDDFINNFSFSRLTRYTGNANASGLRSTDLQDYGKYFSSAEKVAGVFKSGFSNGSTTAMVEAMGQMLGYLPYESSGFRRYAQTMMDVIYDLRAKTKFGFFKEPDTNGDGSLKGEKTSSKEYLVDESGYWVPESESKRMLFFNSPLELDKNIKSLGERDIEYALRYVVSQGVLSKAHAEQILDKRYGIFNIPYVSRFWRWTKRYALLDSPWYFIDSMIEQGKATGSAILKHIFSG